MEALGSVGILATVPVGNPAVRSLWEFSRHAMDDAPPPVYVMLAASIFTATPGRYRTVLIVGSQPEDQSPEVALGVAMAVGESGQRTALVDAFSKQNEVGDDPQPRFISGAVELIPYFGSAVEGITEHDEVERIVADSGRFLVVRGGPWEAARAGPIWAAWCDATVVVVTRDRTRKKELRDTLNSLRLLNANVIGIVVAQVPRTSTLRSKSR